MWTCIEIVYVYWCRWRHKRITRPMNGVYTCLKCGRQYRGPWR